MEINIPPKQDDPQRLIALQNVPKEFWLSALEINQMVNVLKFLLGQGSKLYKGEHDSLYKLELAHPDPEPGSYAQILVDDPELPNQKAEWDNDKKKWIVTGDYDYPTTTGSSQAFTRLDSLVVGWISGYNYEPRAFFTIDGIPYTDTRAFTIAPHATLDKICTFAVNTETKKLEVLEGDPAENPVELQTIDYTKYLVGPFVIIKGGTTQPDNINITEVYQENLGTAGGEADVTGGPDFDFANAENPAKGNVAIKVIDEISGGQLIGFEFNQDIPIGNAKQLLLQIQNINPGDFHIRMVGKKRGGRLDSFILPAVKDYGYNPTNTTAYQTVILPVDTNQLESFYRINLVSKVAGWKFFVDDIRFSGGEAIPDSGSNNYVTQQDLANYALNDLSNLVSNLSPAQQTSIKQKLNIVDGITGGIINDPQIIDLGDILTDTIEDAFNDDALAADIIISGSEYTILKAIQDGVNREWLFVGQPGTYDGSGNIAIAADFFIGRESAVAGGYTPPGDYPTVQDMFDDQASQTVNTNYVVSDASAWSTVTAGWAKFQKLATSAAAEEDYRKIAENESLDTSISIQDATGAEQFKISDALKFDNVAFDILNKKITPNSGVPGSSSGLQVYSFGLATSQTSGYDANTWGILVRSSKGLNFGVGGNTNPMSTLCSGEAVPVEPSFIAPYNCKIVGISFSGARGQKQLVEIQVIQSTLVHNGGYPNHYINPTTIYNDTYQLGTAANSMSFNVALTLDTVQIDKGKAVFLGFRLLPIGWAPTSYNIIIEKI